MGTNKLTLIAPDIGSNVLTDDDFKSNTSWDNGGIGTGEVAYSARLNTILRQITTVTHSFGELISNELNKNIGSYNDVPNNIEAVSEALVKQTINKLILDLADNKNTTRAKNTVWSGPATGSNAAPTFRALVSDDIPSLATSKITSGTFGTSFITDGAITAIKLASDSVTTVKILNSNVTTAKIADLAITVGKLADNAVETAKIKDGNVTTGKIADNAITTAKILNANVTADKIANANVTLNKLAADIYSGGVVLDSLISPKHRSSRGYTVNASNQLVETELSHVILTQAQYNAITKQANTIYTIVG